MYDFFNSDFMLMLILKNNTHILSIVYMANRDDG